MCNLLRMWVNQPSTLQPDHALHGVNVLMLDEPGDYVYVWFVSGPIVSQRIARLSLSAGWR